MKSIIPILIILSIFCSGCTKETSEDSGSNDSSGSQESSVDTSSLVRCGVFTDGAFQSSVPFERSEPVRVRALGPDVVVITRVTGDQAGGEQLVKLQGITSSGISSGKIRRAIDLIRSAVSSGSLFLPAGDGCAVTLSDGAQGVFGHIFTVDGISLNEVLVQRGLAMPEAGACGGDALAGCYAGLPVQEEFSDQVINRFLWKPVSESDGKLVILHNAFNVNVSVEGATSSMSGDNRGPSNGFGSTIRYPFPGCSYGRARLHFFDSLDRVVPLANGETSLVINNGCDRTELRF